MEDVIHHGRDTTTAKQDGKQLTAYIKDKSVHSEYLERLVIEGITRTNVYQ
jgi:hypothetical protein